MADQEISLSSNELLNSTISLLERGEKEIQLKDEFRDLIFILGDTAIGIPFIQQITGDYSNVTLAEAEQISGEFINSDNDYNIDILEFSLKYHKGCPESISEVKPSIFYYSCFSDVRNTDLDIVNIYFANKVLSHADRIKIIFAVSYSSLKKGFGMVNFLKFLKHMSDFVKDIEKYRNSLAMIVIGIEELNSKMENDYLPFGDNQLISDIANFLLDVRQYIAAKQKYLVNSVQDEIFYGNAMKFIDIIIQNDGERYKKIGIFSKLQNRNSNDNISLLQEEKNYMTMMICDELSFIEKLDSDFSCNLSEKSEADIEILVKEINDVVSHHIKIIVGIVQEHYQNQVQTLLRKLEIFVTDKDIFDANSMEALSIKFKNEHYTISRLVDTLQKSLTIKVFVNEIKVIASLLDINVLSMEIQNIERYATYFDILKGVSKKEFGMRTWSNLIKDLSGYITESRKIIQNYIDTEAEKAKNRIHLNLESIRKQLRKSYNEKLISNISGKGFIFQKYHDVFAKNYETLFNMTEEMKHLETVGSLVQMLKVNSNISGIAASKTYLKNIENEERKFMLLQFLSIKDLDNGASTWSKEFKETADFLNETKIWYSFLTDLYTKFSEYSIQMGRKNFVDFLESSKNSNTFYETNVTPTNFEIFLGKIRNLNVAEYESIKNIPLTESRINELNKLVNLTLKHNITIQCTETNMFVKGNYVSLQEVHHILLTHNDQNCKEFYDTESNIKYINVFALNTLFVDQDLQLQGKKKQLIFISPLWEVIGSRVINLNGKNGSTHSQTKADDCLTPGSDGDPGKPGEPGGPGGIFYGIGKSFVGGSNLTITAHGGNGSSGQEGGNGCDGMPGDDVKLPDTKSTNTSGMNCCYPDSIIDLEFLKGEGFSIRYGNVTFHINSKDAFINAMLQIKYRTENGFRCEFDFEMDPENFLSFDDKNLLLYGTSGRKGGSGGDGGKGGLGGNPGSIKIVEIEKLSEINTIASKGKNGRDGQGGKEGRGGKDGEDAIAKCLEEETGCFLCFLSDRYTIRWILVRRVFHNRQGQNGQIGRDGFNSKNIKAPDLSLYIHELPQTINKYKRYLRDNLDDDLKRHSLIKFYEQININYAVRKAYDIVGLVAEFKDLENQYSLLKKETDFYPFFKYLLERIGEYSECTENCDDSRDDKIVRSFLYAAVLSKINSLKEGKESDLIIDIEKYLDIIKTEIDLLQNLENVNSKANAVNKMKREYKYRIDKKIEEAKYFIENTISIEINKISRDIDNNIHLLINEAISSEEKKKELRETLKLKTFFSLFKGLSQVISYLGSKGKAISKAIELIMSVGEYFLVQNNVKPLDTYKNAMKVNIVENNIQIEKTEHLNNVLNTLVEKTIEYPEELGSICRKVTDMKNRLHNIRTHKMQYNEVRKLEQELKDTLKAKELDLKTQITKRSPYVIEVMKKFVEAIEVGSLFVDIYNKYKDEGDKIAVIKEAIEHKENEITRLRDYEEQIYETVMPALENVKQKLQVFANEPNNRSQVALDVGKWEIQRILKYIGKQMQRVIEEMQLKINFSHTLEKFEEAISLLITIYDRIQQYEDEQILGNHIANVCSVSPTTLSIMDQNLVNITSYLELSIRSSLVLKNYKSALNAFKQWVFPFASHYLEESTFSSRFLQDGNLQTLIFNIGKEIQDLKKKISLYKASTKDTDEILIRGEFNSRCNSCEPFFVWKDEQFRAEISRILSGETVALKADVRFSEPGKDVIKFKSIKLHFKSKNETIQSRLDETLKGFDVSATHIGNSYYRYQNEIHLITSPKRSIFYSVEENSRTGDPVRENEVYIKIKNGDLMLSPYAMWILKLNATKRGSFRDLNIYKGDIDLELEGKGNYVVNTFGYENFDYVDDYRLDASIESQNHHRVVRSLGRRSKPEKIAVRSAVSNLSSPINKICNFLKIYTVTSITNSFNKILTYGNKIFKNSDIINNTPMTSIDSSHQDFFNEKQKSNLSNLSEGLLEKRIDPIEEPILESNIVLCNVSKVKSFHANTKMNDFYVQIKSFILNEQKSNYIQTVLAPDLNPSLLFADFISRLFTGVKYEKGMDESLMSPKQVIFKRCCESSIKSEKDIRQNIRLLAEIKENIKISWFSSIKRNVKLVFQSLGLISKEQTDDYIRDIRHLFV